MHVRVRRGESRRSRRNARRLGLHLIEREYDDLGRVARLRTPGERERRHRYDDEHRLVVYEDVAFGETVTRVRFGYDEDHNVTSVQIGEQPAWHYAYTPAAELARMIAPSGATSTRYYGERGGLERATNWDGHVWQWTRDARGRVVTETNPLGHTWHVEYLDAEGRSVRVVEPDERVYEREVSTDERTIVERLPGGRSRWIELSSCDQPIALCDEEGALTRLTWGTEPGELRAITNANGAIYTFTYDADMRLVERRTFDGRFLRTEWVGARIDRTLDVMGRPIAHKTPYGPEAAFAWTAGGACSAIRYRETVVTFERDAVGRETKRHLGEAGAFEQSYDSVGRLVAQVFRPRSRPAVGGAGGAADASPQWGGVSRHFGFDARGFLASIEDSLRGATRLMHNDRGDLTGVVRQSGASDFYAYDPSQNRVYHAATEHGAALASALDKVARERDVVGPVPVDLVAARFPHHESSFGYATGDRVVVVSRADSRTELTYDANGQVTSKSIVCGPERTTWTYGWNARGELVSVTTPNGKVWTYRYDAAGRRIEKRSPTGDRWRYVWMGAVLLHTLKNDTLTETYLHEPGGTCPVLRDDGAVHFILPDQNDSPSEEISATGSLEWTARKGTWSEGFNAVGANGGEPFLGQWYDAESRLHYNFFRYYDPELGRYLSPDPVDLLGGLNAYVAVSDPFSEYDRYGLSTTKSDGCGGDGPAKPKPKSPPHEDDEGEFVKDFSTENTRNVSARYASERDARNLARTKLGRDAVQVEPGKLRSQDGRWQYRGKPNDLAGHGPADSPHIHLERLNPQTGEVLENWHLRW